MKWSEIYEKDFIYVNECYKLCDGYCCKNFFGEYFKFLDKEAVILPLIDEEYEEYKKRGGIENINATKKEIFFEDKIFTFYLLKCKEKGLCNPHLNRPFICRVYPYLPVVDIDGNIIDFVYAALIDNLVNRDFHKCPLVKEESIKNSLKNNLKDISFSPKMIFALNLANLLVKYLKIYIPERMENSNIKDIVKKFEMLFLSNKIFKDKNFQLETKEIYNKVKDRYGDFL